MAAGISYDRGDVVFLDDRVENVWLSGISAIWNSVEGIADNGAVYGLLLVLVSPLLIIRVISLVVG